MHGLQFYTFIPTLCLSRFSKATLLFFVGSGTASMLDLFGTGLGKIVGTASDLSRGFFLHSTPRLSASLISASKQCSFEVTTTQHRMVRRTIPLISRSLHLVSPLFAHLRVLREEKQAYSILVGFATASSDTALHHSVLHCSFCQHSWRYNCTALALYHVMKHARVPP